ncbi:helix-turn-helix domain-containing protein [Ferrimicrobium sp.]|uniref:helix-turn-helix domain-containing protein n=1 Tax=Ferrimicrobium sp. TaxID=2926050 RepID=UPI0026220346|nr:helix-turn-helix domain-containing protein [Ferrimicrobium sp.]
MERTLRSSEPQLKGESLVGFSGPDTFPPILDSKLAAKLLHCTVNEVQKLAREGIIPANRAPNGRWKFSRDALIAWCVGR